MVLSESACAAMSNHSLPRNSVAMGTRGPLVRFNKGGDIDKERRLEERMRDLGLYENKLHIERQLMERLERLMDQRDDLSQALVRCRRKRPLRDRIRSAMDEIRQIIRPKVIRDAQGNKTAYTVHVLMGCFTSDVSHSVLDDRQVALYGTTPPGSSAVPLSKEIVLEYPIGVDLDQVSAIFSAGVFKISAPFTAFRKPSESSSDDSRSLPNSLDTDPECSAEETGSVESSEDILDSEFRLGGQQDSYKR